MSRLASTMRLDAIVQLRNKFYHIGVGVAVFMTGVLLAFATDPETLGIAIPTLYLLVIGGTTMIQVAGQVIFEKNENTLDALTVMPLRVTEYINSKTLTLTAIAVLESTIAFVGAYVLRFGLEGVNLLLLYVGIVALAVFLTLVGFVLVARYDQVTDFLVPAAVIGTVTQLPFLHLLDIAPSPVWFAIPTMPMATLIVGGFRELALWELAYGVIGSAVLIAGTYWWALRAFDRFIIRKEKAGSR